MVKGSMDKDKGYKRVLAFLRENKPDENKVLNALKIFDKTNKSEYFKLKKGWRWFCYFEMVRLKEDPKNKKLSTSAIAQNFVIKKDYIRASAQYKQGQKGTQKDKARMFYEHYKSCKKVMDQLRASLKNKKK
jgi:hypothetical protein|tara:strand:- start:2012 stop:2407 length:396 start_codon:yes stop_codon:yes gene_type:complete